EQADKAVTEDALRQLASMTGSSSAAAVSAGEPGSTASGATAAGARAKVQSNVVDVASQALLRATSNDDCWAVYMARVQSNLHLIMSVPPVSAAVRARLLVYPSFISHATWDCYHTWQPEALLAVAQARFAGATWTVPYLDHAAGGATPQVPAETRVLSPSACTVREDSVPPAVLDGGLSITSSLALAAVNIFMVMPAATASLMASAQREVRITPRSYIEFLHVFMRTWAAKRKAAATLMARLTHGISTLHATNAMVAKLKDRLLEMQPALALKRTQAAELLERAATQRAEAEVVASKVTDEETVVRAQAEATAALQAEAAADLSAAMPALNAALAAVESLDKAMINEMKSYSVPPPAVRTVMEAVCVLLSKDTDWDSARRLLGSEKPNFQQMLETYDRDNIPAPTLKRLARYTSSPTMSVDAIRKVSVAAASVCMWVHAVEQYNRIAKEVAPKQERLRDMNQALAAANEQLAGKRADLAQIQTKLTELQAQVIAVTAEKERLEEENAIAQTRLARANQLVQGLGNEGNRWQASVARMQKEGRTMLGDCFLSSAFIAFAGPFHNEWRQRLRRAWSSILDTFNAGDVDAWSTLPLPPVFKARRRLPPLP
ncbi:MAG: hypothetical protein EOO41_02640, partial [Methanobacteriota archaeon]